MFRVTANAFSSAAADMHLLLQRMSKAHENEMLITKELGLNAIRHEGKLQNASYLNNVMSLVCLYFRNLLLMRGKTGMCGPTTRFM